jgi:hypothetical protein
MTNMVRAAALFVAPGAFTAPVWPWGLDGHGSVGKVDDIVLQGDLVGAAGGGGGLSRERQVHASACCWQAGRRVSEAQRPPRGVCGAAHA